FALPDSGGVRDLVNLQPQYSPAVSKDQQIAVRGSHQQVLHEIFRARSHADSPFAASRLPPIAIDAGALQVSAARDSDGDIFHRDQVFQANFPGVIYDLCAPLVSEVLLYFLQLFDDQIFEHFIGTENLQVLGDAPLDLRQLVEDLLLLHSGQALELQLDNGLRLFLG